MAEWISVKDRLPKAETDVLVFNGNDISILTYGHNKYGILCFLHRDDCGYWKEAYSPQITHWRYLPKPPKGE